MANSVRDKSRNGRGIGGLFASWANEIKVCDAMEVVNESDEGASFGAAMLEAGV